MTKESGKWLIAFLAYIDRKSYLSILCTRILIINSFLSFVLFIYSYLEMFNLPDRIDVYLNPCLDFYKTKKYRCLIRLLK